MARIVILAALLLCVTLVAGLAEGESAVLAACGMAVALQLSTVGPVCSKEVVSATVCPASCKTVVAVTKAKPCSDALAALGTPAINSKIAEVRSREAPAPPTPGAAGSPPPAHSPHPPSPRTQLCKKPAAKPAKKPVKKAKKPKKKPAKGGRRMA
jgi:hypothetical protein